MLNPCSPRLVSCHVAIIVGLSLGFLNLIPRFSWTEYYGYPFRAINIDVHTGEHQLVWLGIAINASIALALVASTWSVTSKIASRLEVAPQPAVVVALRYAMSLLILIVAGWGFWLQGGWVGVSALAYAGASVGVLSFGWVCLQLVVASIRLMLSGRP